VSECRAQQLSDNARSSATAWRTGRQLHAFRFITIILKKVFALFIGNFIRYVWNFQ